MKTLAEKVIGGDPRAVARLITLAENGAPEAGEAMSLIHGNTGGAHVIGITGVMGAGKSSLITELALEFRRRKKKVGIIAIDPTSPFSGGAFLGDRIRMTKVAADPDIFIRSMGTRGMLGGLTGAVYDVVEIMDAAGKDVVIVETVGVGQAEVDVIKIADTTLVVLVPGLGDSIQTIKAGIMEIADIFVVNKADRPDVDRTIAEVESLVELIQETDGRKTPIIPTSAKEGTGIERLADEVASHLEYLKVSDRFERHRRLRYEAELVEIIKKRLMGLIFDEEVFRRRVDTMIESILKRDLDPYTAADEILDGILK